MAAGVCGSRQPPLRGILAAAVNDSQRTLVWEAMLDADMLGRALTEEMKRGERVHRLLALTSAVAGTAAFAALASEATKAVPWVPVAVAFVTMLATQISAVWAFRDRAREVAAVAESCAMLSASWELLWADLNAYEEHVDERLRDVHAQWQQVRARTQKYLPSASDLLRAQRAVFHARGLPQPA
jgi:hypothetical protein